MKVLLIPEGYPTDREPAAGVFMEDQVRALQEISDLTIFHTNPWFRGTYRQIEGVRSSVFHIFSKKWPRPWNLMAYALWEIKSLSFAKKMERPDIIHLHGAALRGPMALALSKYWKVPLIVTEHTGPWSAISARQRVFAKAKAAMEGASCTLPVSQHLKNEIVESGVKLQAVSVLGNPVDTERFSLRKAPLSSPKNILFLGRFDPFKGPLRTLKAFHNVSNDLPGWRLTLAGFGDEARDIASYIQDHDLCEKVELRVGFMNRAEMCDAFHGASFLVFPSQFESFGLVGAEAMATGLPVLITNRTGPIDYFTDGCGLQVDPYDTSALGAGMLRLAQTIGDFDPHLIRNAIESKYSISVYGQKLKTLYTSYLS